MDILNVYISQPMRGRSEEEILSERRKVMEYVQKFNPTRKCREIKSYFTNENRGKKSQKKSPATIDQEKDSPLYILGKAIQLLADADVAVFVENWGIARRCRIEHECAVRYGIKIMDLD